MGWGRSNNDRRSQGDKDEGGAFKNVLQKLSVPHIENSWCKSNPQWKAFSKITTDRQLCAGGRIRKFMICKTTYNHIYSSYPTLRIGTFIIFLIV